VGVLQEDEEPKEVWELAQLEVACFHLRTCKVNLGWLQCRLHRDCVALAFHLQKDRLIAVLRRQVLHLTQILLHCCFATDWPRGLTGQVVQALKEPSSQELVARHR
jgi:hypothetical protein